MEEAWRKWGRRAPHRVHLLVEMWPRCHLTWCRGTYRGTYTRTVTDILDGKPVNVLYGFTCDSASRQHRRQSPRSMVSCKATDFGNNLIRYAVNLRVKCKLPLKEVQACQWMARTNGFWVKVTEKAAVYKVYGNRVHSP